jgi:plastocyanin
MMRSIALVTARFVSVCLAALVAFGVLWQQPAHAESYQIKMGSDNGMLVFEPSNITVKPGDTLTWVNNRSYPHNFVFDKTKSAAELVKLSHSQLSMTPGEQISIEIPVNLAAGTYEYYCEPHRGAGMAGKVTVTS